MTIYIHNSISLSWQVKNYTRNYLLFLIQTESNSISNRNTKNTLLIGIECASISFLIEIVSNYVPNRSTKIKLLLGIGSNSI